FLIASDQYQSEAHFLVRTTDAGVTGGIGVSQVLSAATGLSAAQSEAMSVSDYLTSHDVVATLRKRDQLVERFRRPGVDITSRLSSDNPTPERLLGYYRKQVSVQYNTETGITTLKVRSFTPQDSYHLVRRLLELGESRVNFLNQRGYSDSIATSRRQLADAEQALTAVQLQLKRFRNAQSDIDPKASGQAQIELVTSLNGQLSTARAQLSAMGGLIDRSSPQYRAVAARVAALESQVAAQAGRLTGGGGAIANDIGGYEDLQLRQAFLSKRYEAAATSLERAREQALRQQLYVVRVVDANLPVKALFPERWRILATVVIALLLIYSIGWLIAAGVREHAA
ncbi:MAG: Capsule polysaccharide export-like protein, partial [Sphingomonas bacterium]|nr:Capsule polysaccharide export-like protein [Sphingomonas bacterium]